MRFVSRLLPLAVILACGCTPRETATDGKLHVVCTTSLIADAVQQVGRGRVHVECLMGPGVDPHRYTPSAGDVQKLTSARVVFHHGLHLEGKMGDVLEKARPGQTSVIVTSRLSAKQLRASDAGDGPHDPHVWFDPTLWADCVSPIAEALKDAAPGHAKEFDNAAKEFRDELIALDRELDGLAKSLPAERRKLVTSHDAFGYFGARYGFEVHGLQGVSTASEPSVKTVSELADFLAKNKIPAVFGETSVPPKGLQAVMDATRQKHQHTVRLVGGDTALYSDALGEPGTPGETYAGMVRHNMTTIVTALKAQP